MYRSIKFTHSSGPCEGSTVIAPRKPLTYKIAYLTVSGANVQQVTSDAFKHVCKQLVLIPSTLTSVFSLLEIANEQIPLSVTYVYRFYQFIVSQHGIVPTNNLGFHNNVMHKKQQLFLTNPAFCTDGISHPGVQDRIIWLIQYIVVTLNGYKTKQPGNITVY